ncbi:MAG TPA: rhomboid family intramembrane serine protease [Tepidisphaeraceae bacterium]|nr:rhomboid family intramembrane serine protease [Tepidisphaeraceae bacterium]
MIRVACECGKGWAAREGQPVRRTVCPTCGSELSLAVAEELPDGVGEGDFDAYLHVESGGERSGERIFLGGVAAITIGKAEDRTIRLADAQASRRHCELARLDFGPSRWELRDTGSTNGVLVNGKRVTSAALDEGDTVKVGGHVFRFGYVVQEAPMTAPAPPAKLSETGSAVAGDGDPCPSCDTPLPRGAKICVPCGIYVPSGRPLLTSQGRDEDAITVQAEQWISIVSFVVPVTPMPMPLSSEAYGHRKPYVTWAIAAITIVASFLFYFAARGERGWDFAGKQLMLWPTESVGRHLIRLSDEQVQEFVGDMSPAERAEFEANMADAGGGSRRERERRALETMINALADDALGKPGTFEAYQLVTHAFLHDTSSLRNLILHLGGNMLFFLVFGSRVNALLGNVAMAILYPVLASLAAAAQLMMSDSGSPMLGASGAVMGMAGMYLILFPAHRVFCAMWIRIRWHVGIKLFTLRGFWILAIYFAFDAFMIWLQSGRRDSGGGVAHWAHTGGALAGAAIASGLLVMRLTNCGGGDLFSVVFGRYAWGLIGKPSHWAKKEREKGKKAELAGVATA